ncbi:hypothetical protein Tco_0102219, partial [Tanacetum coccineum]
MALPNEHQLTFNQYVDAQSMFVAIKARFGGNDATKKTQKALLKQPYENFNATSSESLDSIFNRLQKLVNRLAILGVDTPPEDLNVKEEEPKKARENNDAPIIEDWVSDDEEEVEPIPKVEKKTAIPNATKKESVKSEKPFRRPVMYAEMYSCPNAHKHMVPRAVLMKTGLKTVNNAKPVNTVRSVNTARPFSTV